MGFLDNVAKEVFKAATDLDLDSPKDREEVRRKMQAARELQELQRQQYEAERSRKSTGGLLGWLKGK